MRALRRLVPLGLLALAGPAAAAVSAAPDAVSVTIYRDHPAETRDITNPDGEAAGLGMITETRTVEIGPGDDRIVFEGVADGMVPQTAKLEGLPVGVGEQNFDYDLLSPGALLEKSVGQTVRLIRTNRRTGKVVEQSAVIRSAPEGVVLETSDGVEALHCSGLPERLVFDHIPAGLKDRPTLSLRTPGVAPGRYKVRLSYLATGFDWSADYVAHVRPDGHTLDLSGLVTLVNRGAVSFKDAPTQVVAGRWRKVDDDGTDAEPAEARDLSLRCWALGAPPAPPAPPPPPVMAAPAAEVEEVVVTGARKPMAMVKAAELGDYKLYSLPEPTTVAARQVKQVGLIDQDQVAFDWVYGYVVRSSEDAVRALSAPADLRIRLQNTRAANLGKPLPAGTISVVQDDADGHPVLIGQQRIDDTPVGLPIDAMLGRAHDVGVSSRVVRVQSRGKHRTRIAREVTVINDMPGSIDFELSHEISGERFRLVSESLHHAMWRGMPTWRLTLRPGERQTVRYAYEQDD